MEPERRDTYTHIERDRRSGSAMAFIVGGLVVAVLVIALVIWGAPFGTGQSGDPDIEVSTQTEVPGAVENEVEVEWLELRKAWVKACLRGGKVLYARKAVLAMGREGSGAARWPQFESFDPRKRGGNIFHAADEIDFAALKGKRVAVVCRSPVAKANSCPCRHRLGYQIGRTTQASMSAASAR